MRTRKQKEREQLMVVALDLVIASRKIGLEDGSKVASFARGFIKAYRRGLS